MIVARLIKERLEQKKNDYKFELAKNDFNLFCELVGRDRSGGSITQKWYHKEWDQFFNDNKYAIILAPIEVGKTVQRTNLKAAWCIGRNPNCSIGIITAKKQGASQRVSAVKKILETSEEYHKIFPDITPSVNKTGEEKWTNSAFTVQRTIISNDPTIQGVGLLGSIDGARFDYVICDDITTYENTRTPDQRLKVVEWILSTLIPRIVSSGRFEMIVNSWHKRDASQILHDEHGFALRKYEACDQNYENLLDDSIWSAERLRDRRKKMGDMNFLAKLRNIIPDDERSIFKYQWFKNCSKMNGLDFEYRYQRGHEELGIISIDLGATDKTSKKSEENSGKTIFIVSLKDNRGNIRIQWIDGGFLTYPEIIDMLLSLVMRYKNYMVIVESNGIQKLIVQSLENHPDFQNCSVYAHNTNLNKHDPVLGLVGLAEFISKGKLSLPSAKDDSEFIEQYDHLDHLIEECLDYSPMTHTGDRLMAFWFAYHWFKKNSYLSDTFDEMSDSNTDSQSRDNKQTQKHFEYHQEIGYDDEFEIINSGF